MPLVNKKSEEVVKSGTYQQYYLERQTSKSHENNLAHVDQKAERREERRRKASSGKGGGGTQGRETKTKSVKKHTRSSKQTAHGSDSEEDAIVTKKGQTTLVIVSVDDIEDCIRRPLEEEALDDLIVSISEYIQGLVSFFFLVIIQ